MTFKFEVIHLLQACSNEISRTADNAQQLTVDKISTDI